MQIDCMTIVHSKGQMCATVVRKMYVVLCVKSKRVHCWDG